MKFTSDNNEAIEPVETCSMCAANLYRKEEIVFDSATGHATTRYICEEQYAAVRYDFIVKSTYNLMTIPEEDLAIQRDDPQDPELGTKFNKPYLYLS